MDTIQGSKGFIRFNEEHNGIEIYFNSFPDDSIRETIKVIGWRFSSRSRCWFHRNTEENLRIAKELIGVCEEPELFPGLDGFDDLGIIGDTNIIVRTSVGSCIYNEHRLIRGKAQVCIIRNRRIHELWIPVLYCDTCNQFYMYETDFQTARKQGYLCCQVITSVEHIRFQNGIDSWQPISLMRSYGYTVNAIDNIPDLQRREILTFLIQNEIMSAHRIYEFLSWLIRRAGTNSKYQNAVLKWSSDRRYVENYILGIDPEVRFNVRVGSIFRTQKKFSF